MCKIEFDIPAAGFVTVKVVDIIGTPIKTIDSHNEPGRHTIDFNEEKLPPGKYYYKIFFSQTIGSGTDDKGPISSGLIKIES